MRSAAKMLLRGIFLILFVGLAVMGNVQLWMAVFVLGLLVSLFFGRLYCGWVCPINTLTRSVSWVKNKLKIGSFSAPAWLRKPAVRYIALGLFLAVFAYVMISGNKLPVLPALLAIGVALTLFFPEELWHAHICPYGTVFHAIARKPLSGMRIDRAACVSCGACARVCRAEAVRKEAGQYEIREDACLVCFDCADVCKTNAISHRKRPKAVSKARRSEKEESV